MSGGSPVPGEKREPPGTGWPEPKPPQSAVVITEDGYQESDDKPLDQMVKRWRDDA